MQISVRGKNPVIPKKEVRFLVKKFCHVLFGKRLSANIKIQIQYLANIERGTWGYCLPTDCEPNHREFEFILSPNISRNNQIRTIAHELVHAYQFARGLLKQSHGDDYKWMGRHVNIENIEYDKIPWEIQARLMEEELFKWYKATSKEDDLQ